MSDKAWLIAFECLAFFSVAAWAVALFPDAKASVLKRFGGRLSAYLFLKARNLRKKHVTLLLNERPFVSKLSNGLPVLVELPDAASEASGASKQRKGSDPFPSVHNVVPFKRVR